MQKSLRFFACIAALLMAAFTLQAQTPQKFSYQAVVRNASNQLVRNATVGVRISIFQTTAGGTLKFQETHTPTTNDNGLFSIEIGGGTLVSGAINTIDWGDGPYFLRSEVDPLGGTAYTLVADQQLLAVPYALHCDEYQNLEDVLRQNNHAGMVQLKSVKDPTDDQDAVTKHYLDSIVALVSTLTASHVKDTAVSRCGSFTWDRTGQTYNSTGIYLYTLTDACGAGCDTVISLRLTIVQNPSVTLGNIISSVGTSSCAGAIAALTANVTDHTGNLTYTWTKTAGATLASDNTMTVNTNALTSGDNSYHLVVTAAVDGCGSANASEDITISASAASAVTLNEITSSNGTTLCAGGATNLTASAATSTGTVSYVWTATPDATAGLSATTGNIVTATPTTATSYTYTVSATAHQDGCADANASKEITITAVEAPAVALGALSASTGNTICVGETPDLSLSAGTSEGTVSYAWTASPAANSGLTDDNVDHLTVAPTAAGTYTYTVTATASKAYGGCTNANDSKSVTITVNGAPALTLGNIKSNNTAKTVDGLNTTSHTLAANITNPDPLPGTGISYQWYKNNSIMAGETDATLSITTGGVYKVRVTYDNGSCSVNQESEITICETPTVPEIELTSGNASMCAGNSATLAVTAGTYNAAYAYTWKRGGSELTTTAAGAGSSSYAIASAAAGDAGTYTVTAQNVASGCSAYNSTSSDFVITVETPALTLNNISYSGAATGSDASVTVTPNSGTLTLAAELNSRTPASGGTITYAWSKVSAGASELGTGSTLDIATDVTFSDRVYYLRTTYTTDNGCVITADKTIEVSVENPCAAVTTPVIEGDNSVCGSGTVNLGVSSGTYNAGYTYTWSNSSTGQNISPYVSSTTTYTVTAENDCGNTAVSSGFTVTKKNPLSTPSFTTATSSSNSITVQGRMSDGTMYGTYYFSLYSGSTLLESKSSAGTSSSTSGSVTFSGLSSGTYTVKMYFNKDGLAAYCQSAEASTNVTVTSCPTPVVSAGSLSVPTLSKTNQNYTMTVSSVSASNCDGCTYNYTWWANTSSSTTSSLTSNNSGYMKVGSGSSSAATTTTNSLTFQQTAGSSSGLCTVYYHVKITATNSCGNTSAAVQKVAGPKCLYK